MEAERVKEIVDKKIGEFANHLSTAKKEEQNTALRSHRERWIELKEQYGYTLNVLIILKKEIADAEKAEQEAWKELPLCDEERGKLVADRIDPCPWYNYWLCAYHRYVESKDGDAVYIQHKCALPIDETAEELDHRTFKERFEEIEKSYWIRAEQTVNRLGAIENRLEKLENWKGGHIDGHPTACSVTVNKKRIEDVETRLCNHLKMHVEVEK